MSSPEPTAQQGPRGMSLRGALAVFFGAIGFLIGRRVLGDNSFLTHYATGALILDTGSVPTTDPYSFTANGEPWVVQSWLASVLYAGSDQLLGGFGIRALNGVLAGLSAAGLWRLTSRRNSNVFVPLVLTGAVLIIGASMWSPRPLLFGLLGIVVVLAVLEGMISPRWLLPVMWLWVNTHGSFPLAGVLVGAIGVGEWIDSREFPIDTARVLGWVTAGTVLGAVNPLGPKLLWFPVQLLRRGEALENVVEWRPFQLQGLTSWVFAALLVAFIVSVVNRVEWRAIVPSSVFALAALLAIRNIVVASVVLAVLAAPNLPLSAGQLRMTDRGPVPRLLGAGSVTLLLLAAMSTFSAPINLDGYPVDELNALEAEGLLGPEARLLHPEIVGNYLGFAKGTEARVFVDDRFDFYPQQVLDDFDTLLFGGNYAEVVDRYEPSAIVWKSGGGFEAWLDATPEWIVAEPMNVDRGGVVEDSEWFVARRSGATPSPAVLASSP